MLLYSNTVSLILLSVNYSRFFWHIIADTCVIDEDVYKIQNL